MASYVESATLKIVDQATGPLKAINAALKETQRAAQALARSGQMLGRGFRLGAMSSDLGKIKTEMDAVRRAMQQMASAGSTARLGRIDANFSRATASANSFAAAMANLNRQMGQYRSANVGNIRFPTPPRLPPPSNNQVGPANRGWFGQRGFNPNASLADRAQNRVVNAAENALSSGFESSGAARDYGRLLFPKEPEVQKKAEQFAAQVSSEFKSIPIGTILKTWYETAAQVKDPNSPAVNAIVREMLATGIGAQMQGGNAKQSVDGMMKLVKSANLRGDLTTASGDIDAESTTKFMEAVRRAQNVVGRELPHESVFQAIKYARTQRGAIDYDMLGHLLFMAGDIGGSSAGVGLSSFVNQLTGTATKQAMANQAKAGLIAGAIDENNPAGPKKFAYSGTTDAELLQENPRMWIAKHFMGANGVLARAGLDPRTATAGEVNNVIKPMFSNRVAADFLTNMITQFQEYENSKARALKSAYKANDILGVSDASQRYKMFGVTAQLESAFGELTEKLKFAINPVLDAAGAVLNKLTPTNGQGGAGLTAGLLGGGLAAGGYLAKYVAEHPGLALAAVGHGFAAKALTGAAAALTGAAAKLSLGGLAGAGLGAASTAATAGAGAVAAARSGILARALGVGMKGLGYLSAASLAYDVYNALNSPESRAEMKAGKDAAEADVPRRHGEEEGKYRQRRAREQLRRQSQEVISQAMEDALDEPNPGTIRGATEPQAPRDTVDILKAAKDALEEARLADQARIRNTDPNAEKYGPPSVPSVVPKATDPAIPQIEVPPPEKSWWRRFWDAVIPPAGASTLPPGATLDGPIGGAGSMTNGLPPLQELPPLPPPGGGADLQAVLNDAVFSIAGSMQSAGGAIEGAAGELAGALSGASGGISEAGGAVVGALQSVAGQIASISIQAPSVSAPANTGTNGAVVR